ncbi:MAG: arsenite methyltransferase [Pelolinea sp.]|nr:arsenite methyltransferase [Pelolinea sp.]
MSVDQNQKDRITQAVRSRYGGLAEQSMEKSQRVSCCGGGQSCSCGSDSGLSEEAAEFYNSAELEELSKSVTDISLGCGNPTTIGDLKPGQTVLDLGSGGGIDCFLAAKKVGPTGQVIGLDMTPKMLDLARANAKKQGVKNVDFRYGYIEDIPLPDASVDVIISNCVINLSADKATVFSEAHRVLRPGGVLNVSDIVTYSGLPQQLVEQLSAWASCISGALDEEEYLGLMRTAGFSRIEVLERKYYSPDLISADEGVQALLEESKLDLSKLDKKIASITLRAYKDKF